MKNVLFLLFFTGCLHATAFSQNTNAVQYHDVTFVVGKKVDQISVSGYGYLKLTTRNDGNQEVSLNLKEGDYELRVFEDGQLKCNKFFKADRPQTIDFPCRQ